MTLPRVRVVVPSKGTEIEEQRNCFMSNLYRKGDRVQKNRAGDAGSITGEAVCPSLMLRGYLVPEVVVTSPGNEAAADGAQPERWGASS